MPTSRAFRLIVLLVSMALARGVTAAWAAPASRLPIRYTVDLSAPASHLVGVAMTVARAPAGAEIQFPAWNALYQFRDFVRDVQHLQAVCGGTSLALRPMDVNTWQIGDAPCNPLVVRYQVFANQPGVFSSQLAPDHAFLNPAQILFYVPSMRQARCSIRFVLPPGWKLATPLPGQGLDFAARDYDGLADSPVEAGIFQTQSFRQNGSDYRIVVRNDGMSYPAQKLEASIRRITATETALMGGQPCQRYTFIFHFLSAGGGGMEHACGTAIAFPAPLLESGWQGLENTIAHEFFHLWNVKRIRPQGLVPIDYVRGNDTRGLWFSEGVTSTYAELALLRAGLIDRRAFYAHLAALITGLQARKARHDQSVALAGMDAWLEKYPDYNRADRSISYYNKGELLGDLLDLEILHASGGSKSMDDLMRRLYAESATPFTETKLEDEIAALGPGPTWTSSFFHEDVDGTSELDYSRYLAYAGLDLQTQTFRSPDWGFAATQDFDGVLRVATVDPASDAAKAGIEPGDALEEVNGQRLYALPRNLEGVKPGQRIKLQILRGSRTMSLKFNLGSASQTSYGIVEMREATPEQAALRNAWLSGKPAKISQP